MRHFFKFVLVVVGVGFAGCGGGSQPVPTSSTNPGESFGLGTPIDLPIQYATEFPGALPQDSLQPWEELGSEGNVIPEGNKGVSATNESSEFFAGTQTDSESGDTSGWNGALRMASGAVGDGNLSYAIYRIPLGGSEPGVVSVDANLRPMGDGNLGGYYVGLADYGNNSWQWFGLVTDAHWRISTVQAAREAARFTSGIGSVFVCVVAYDGASVDLVGVGVDPVNPTDTTAPDAPPAPTLTPVAGGLLVDWTAFAGSDIAGYKVYYKDSAYTELTAFSANTLDQLHDSLVRLSLDEYTPRTWWVAISTVDLSGNESAISPAVSARPLVSTGSLPPVWIDLDNATALINQPIGMTATGADTYDWDLDGDGVFDVLSDETGTQNIDTSAPGIIRPVVRGNSSGGSFIALGAVSVIVTSNARPVVQGFVEPAFGVAPLEVQFTSIQIDMDGDVVEYIWDFTSNGSVNFRFSTAGGATDPAPYTFTTPGLYNAKVRAWDDDGAWDVDTVTINVLGNSTPVAIISSVLECQMGDSVTFDAQQSHDHDGTVVQYEWDLDGDGSFEYDSTPAFWAENVFSEPGAREVGLRVTDNLGAQGTTAILLTVHGASPIIVDGNGNVGWYTSLVVVNGNPAISYRDNTNWNLNYVRATDASGRTWGTPVAVVTAGNAGHYTSLAVVNGNPAISYFDDSNDDLLYVRAADANGITWGTPITLDSTGDVGRKSSLAVVNGNPAISFYDLTQEDLKYVRATNSSGTSWGTPVAVDSGGGVGWSNSLAVISGNPAISYRDSTNQDLKFIRATDASGSAWGAALSLDSTGNVGMYSSLSVVDGNPAISYRDDTNSNLKFARSTNASGSNWGTPVAVATSGLSGADTSLTVIGGFPAIGYYDSTNDDLKYVRATDASGSSWGIPLALDTAGDVGIVLSLAQVNGNPAISYYDVTNLKLKYVMLY